VNVELEEVVELVGEGGNGAGYCFGDAVVQGQRASCLVASVEGHILEFAETVGDLLIVSDGLGWWHGPLGVLVAYMFSFPGRWMVVSNGDMDVCRVLAHSVRFKHDTGMSSLSLYPSLFPLLLPARAPVGHNALVRESSATAAEDGLN
jgi:hypothetical protein